jgi:Rrf2 family protein
MFRLSKKVEYAILAMQYMASHKDEILSAKEIAQALDISFEFLSKAMQTLMKEGFVTSIQGIKGGYNLVKTPDKIAIIEILRAFNENIGLVECLSHGIEDCNRTDNCNIKNPMNKLRHRINYIFQKTTIADLMDDYEKAPMTNGYRNTFINLENLK